MEIIIELITSGEIKIFEVRKKINRNMAEMNHNNDMLINIIICI